MLLQCGQQPHTSLRAPTPCVAHLLPWAVGWAHPLPLDQQDRTFRLQKGYKKPVGLSPGGSSPLSHVALGDARTRGNPGNRPWGMEQV